MAWSTNGQVKIQKANQMTVILNHRLTESHLQQVAILQPLWRKRFCHAVACYGITRKFAYSRLPDVIMNRNLTVASRTHCSRIKQSIGIPFYHHAQMRWSKLDLEINPAIIEVDQTSTLIGWQEMTRRNLIGTCPCYFAHGLRWRTQYVYRR